MKAKQRLDVGEDIAYRLAACRRELHLAKHLDHAKVLVQHWSIVQPTRDGRYVDIENGPRRIRQPGCEVPQRGIELLLRLLAVAVPGSDVGVAPADELMVVVQLRHAALGLRAVGRLVEHLAHLSRAHRRCRA